MTNKRPAKTEYNKYHQDLVKQAVAMDATLIACNKNDESQILGWINFGDKHVNYIFVKEVFEHMGIAKELLKYTGFDGENTTVTHYTKHFLKKFGLKKEYRYNPYLFTNRSTQ